MGKDGGLGHGSFKEQFLASSSNHLMWGFGRGTTNKVLCLVPYGCAPRRYLLFICQLLCRISGITRIYGHVNFDAVAALKTLRLASKGVCLA